VKVLALAAYPIEAANTRYRLVQLLPALRRRGIEVTLHPFLDGAAFATLYDRRQWPRTAANLLRASGRRLVDVRDARRADVLLVLREAAMLGPPVTEWLALRYGRCPMVLDLDDATYVSYVSPTYGRLAKLAKWPAKADQLIRWASVATCGNRRIAEYVAAAGTPARVIPPVVDPDLFRPADLPANAGVAVPTVGWVGTHSTFPFVEWLAPVLEDLARTRRFRVKLVGSGKPGFTLAGLEVENVEWRLEREVDDFRSLDVGLYPIVEDEWSVAKSGLKSVQYMGVGVPFVASPVGAVGEIGEPGVTHLLATTRDEWRSALARLIDDPGLRRTMGGAGRRHALAHYTVEHAASALADALSEAAS
jgi:glycosyltransferase involved in cell wall biosynthesis